MRKRLKRINIAGTWTIAVQVEVFSESVADIEAMLNDARPRVEKAIKQAGNRPDLRVNVKEVKTFVQGQR